MPLGRLWKRGLLIAVGLLLAVLGGRIAWIAMTSETGVETLGALWRDASIGQLRPSEPIYDWTPDAQANFWLAEVDRVLAAHPNDARLMMGAAWVLDSPGPGYQLKHLRKLMNFPGSSPIPDFDQEAIAAAENAFEEGCGKRCLELALEAARLEPSNVEWWQLVGLLVYRRSFFGSPRAANWLDILDECARHDPDNALYDYTAAVMLWQKSAKREWRDDDTEIEVHDDAGFQQGVDRFVQGQAKPRLVVGHAGFSATLDFLALTSTTSDERIQIGRHREILTRRGVLPVEVCRWQRDRGRAEEDRGNLDAATAIYQAGRRVADQYALGGTAQACESLLEGARCIVSYSLLDLATKNPTHFSDGQRDQFKTSYIEIKVNQEILKCAGQKMAPTTSVGSGVAVVWDMFTSSIILTVCPWIVSLLAVAIVAGLIGRWAGGDARATAGWVWPLPAALLAAAATIALFGLAPAGVIAPAVQGRVVGVALVAIPLLPVVWLAMRRLRRRPIRFTIRDMLVTTFFMALALTAAVGAASSEDEVSMPALAMGVTPGPLGVEIYSKMVGAWYTVVMQWLAYRGPALTALAWVGLLWLVAWRRTGRGDRSVTLRHRIGASLRALVRPAIVAAVLLLIVYGFVVPGWMVQTEVAFQQKAASLRNPREYWAKLEKAVVEIHADASLMSQLKADAEAEMANEFAAKEDGSSPEGS